MTSSPTESFMWYMETHPSISLSGLEQEAQLPPKTLQHVMKGRRELSDIHWLKLYPIIVKYGYRSRPDNWQRLLEKTI